MQTRAGPFVSENPICQFAGSTGGLLVYTSHSDCSPRRNPLFRESSASWVRVRQHWSISIALRSRIRAFNLTFTHQLQHLPQHHFPNQQLVSHQIVYKQRLIRLLPNRKASLHNMYSFKVILFAVFALLAVSAIADVTGKFNIVSKYKVEKVVNGKKTITEQRNPMGFENKKLKSDKTLTKMVKDFKTWSNGEYLCSKAKIGSIYNVAATRVYNNKNESNDANNRAKAIIVSHQSEE